ncbi:hypothetical protein BDD12DRAFT_881905 [Trichophaea hybrida]|nr:hypothetical protein BDD12DRAFT_881905 [Trichophaea hybrida]
MAATSCGATDIKCICTDKAFMVTIGPCVKTSCDTADQEKTIQFAVALCKNAGVTIPQSEIDSLTKSSEPSSSASHSTKAGTYASATPSSEEPTSTSTNSASSSVPSTGAASKLGVSGLGFGAAAAALFLL